MHPALPIAVAAFSMVQQSQSDLKRLQGYGLYRFGMAIEEVKKLTDIIVIERSATGQSTVLGTSTVTAFGLRLRPIFHFRNEALQDIRLEFAAPGTRQQCVQAYSEAVDRMTATFGGAVASPSNDSTGKVSNFKFSDGGAVQAQMTYRSPTSCGITFLFQKTTFD